MNTFYTSAQIVEAARGFLNVPFRHQGRDRSGIDCIGMIIASMLACCPDIYERLHDLAIAEGRSPRVTPDEFYKPTYIVNDEPLMVRFLEFIGTPRLIPEICPADVLMFNIKGVRTFSGLACERNGLPYLLSCFSMARRATERHLAGTLRLHLYAAFKLRGIA